MRILLLVLCFAASTSGADKHADGKASPPDNKVEFLPIEPGIDATQESAISYQKALIAYYEYKERGYVHRSRVYVWQYVSTIGIFVSVLAIVFCGLYFSYIQFSAATGSARKRKASEAPNEPDIPSKIKASLSGIEVSSNVVGLVILALSIIFFYLYLVHVYPIRDAL